MLVPLRFSDPQGREILQHSAAHLVAKALTEAIPEALPTAGPPTEEGFYYDFDVRPLLPEDVAKIRELAERSVKAREKFERIEVPKGKALELARANRHKQRYIAEVPDGESVSFYQTGEFLDLCRGPHVPDTGGSQDCTCSAFRRSPSEVKGPGKPASGSGAWRSRPARNSMPT